MIQAFWKTTINWLNDFNPKSRIYIPIKHVCKDAYVTILTSNTQFQLLELHKKETESIYTPCSIIMIIK